MTIKEINTIRNYVVISDVIAVQLAVELDFARVFPLLFVGLCMAAVSFVTRTTPAYSST